MRERLMEWRRVDAALKADTAIDEDFDPRQINLFADVEDGEESKVLNVLLAEKLYSLLAYMIDTSEPISVEHGQTLLQAVIKAPMSDQDRVRNLEALVELNERSLNRIVQESDRPVMVEEVKVARADVAKMREHRVRDHDNLNLDQRIRGLTAIADQLLRIQREVDACIRGEERTVDLGSSALGYEAERPSMASSLRSAAGYVGGTIAGAASWATGFLRGRPQDRDEPRGRAASRGSKSPGRRGQES